jgi:hypothetical protein
MMTLLACALAPRQIHFNIPPWLFWTIFLGILGLFVLMLWAKARELRQRREDLEQFGMEMGFTFCEKPDEALAQKLAQIRLSGARMDFPSKCSNVLQGRAGGGEVVIADRSSSSDDSSSTATIAAFNFETALPGFSLFPENRVWRVLEKVGYTDIRLEGAPEFSRRFFLHGENEAEVRALFKPAVTQAFEALDPKTHLFVSASGPWLVFYRPTGVVPVNKLRELLQQVEPLANAFRTARSSSVFR